MTDDPITPEEMRAMFGETMPIEAIQLVFNAGPDETVGEVRAKLRALAKQRHMSPDEITPARLRELADEGPLLHTRSWQEIVAALRAAAAKAEEDERTIRDVEKQNDELLDQLSTARATLAAREALLRRAGDELFDIATIIEDNDVPDIDGAHPRALAAEIAAALGGKTDE